MFQFSFIVMFSFHSIPRNLPLEIVKQRGCLPGHHLMTNTCTIRGRTNTWRRLQQSGCEEINQTALKQRFSQSSWCYWFIFLWTLTCFEGFLLWIWSLSHSSTSAIFFLWTARSACGLEDNWKWNVLFYDYSYDDEEVSLRVTFCYVSL